jgi:hypothetical protein
MNDIWKKRMGDVTSLSLTQVFDTVYLECCIEYKNGKVVNGKKNLSSKKLFILNEIYRRTNYVSCNPYAILKCDM